MGMRMSAVDGPVQFAGKPFLQLGLEGLRLMRIFSVRPLAQTFADIPSRSFGS